MCTAGFPEPLTFSLRARKVLAERRDDFDLIHDNQCLGQGLLGHDQGRLAAGGDPAPPDHRRPRPRAVSHARTPWRKLTFRRWYGFLRMQARVTRQLPRIITVSQSSRADIAEQMGIDANRIFVVPVGVDHLRFRPLPHIKRVPGRLMTTASADVPLKGLVPLLEALAKVRTERHAELVVVGMPKEQTRVGETISRLGLASSVRFLSGVSDERIVELYASAEVAVVPSLYEGFSLPAVEAMACGVPLVGTTGGAVPEVIGQDGVTGLLVPPGDPGALAAAIGRALDDPELRARLGAAGRERVLEKFTWRKTAEGTVEQYREALLAAAADA